ncbi:unnamed protein product [Oppiella nova]|uniref:serine C-palmitoyltransferase n=1 Tax=Oppiella nova TaxID=334625 RepID=A0A7R9QUL5_9ACAR|nr:unnamed protein product [Oppiella nova]CAG2176187.1 unnamed protein product [Oppiella nova]
MIKQLGVGIGSTANEIGRQQMYSELECLVAKYLGVEDNMDDLERIVRNSIIEGQPKTRREWRKIMIIVEGIYSMEGTIVSLPRILQIKKKYKTYLYLDEAHSIGALGSRAKGVCDYYGLDPKDVDILMGTFTKSFGASGGYIGGNKRLIDYLRQKSADFYYANPMSPPVMRQIYSVINELMQTNDSQSNASQRVQRLHRNTTYFRQKLKDLGFHVDGHTDSPVIILLVYLESPLKCLMRRLFECGIGVVGVSFPVTTLLGAKARICMSASHSLQTIHYIIDCLDRIGTDLHIKYN